MSDLVTFGETSLRLSPPSNARLETTDALNVWATGAASNVAIAASRLGTDSMWTSKLADTPLGRRAVSEVRGHDITTDITWVDDEDVDVRQGLTFYEEGSTPRDSFVLDDRHGTATESVEPGDLPMGDVQNADAVFASGETLALAGTVGETVQAVLRAAGGRSVFGLDYRPDLWPANEAREAMTDLLPAVDVFVANEQEAQAVLKKTGEPPQIAHQMATEWEFETVIITQGDHGALVWHDSTIHDRDAVETDVIEATGEHGAFTGAFLARRLAGDDVGSAASHGIAAAALARTIPGPVPTISPEEVDHVVDQMDSGSRGGSSGGIR